ncbi:hypothetical protein FJZ20_00770, partial [Candidatus Pacearchaeota archaeon]|nr:hypothetical protein [Candidatus Pacearchaeota archaeon]
CNCPSILRKDEPEFRIERKLHAVPGESGEVDIAAIYQTSLGKNFVYEGYDTTCLVELDESPPNALNLEALKIALHISLLLNCKIVPLSQIMRKTVIDGSNTSGFQRTVLISKDGWVETEFGRVGIQYIYLEEDAARKVSSSYVSQKEFDKEENNVRKVSDAEGEGEIVYRLDRLGIPLVEIVTAPDIKTPEQAKEVALHIGQILRACNVRRGIGTIRQDVNVSIEGHPRAEIKGFQDPKIFVKVVEKEIERQLRNLKEKKELVPEVRGANLDGTTKYLRPLPGSARMYPETDLPLLKISREIIDDAKKTVPKLKSDLTKELEKDNLNSEMLSLLLKQGKLEDFKEMIKIVNKPNLIVKILLLYPKEISSHEKIPLNKIEKILTKDVLSFVLENLKKGKITEKQIKSVLENIVKGKNYKDAFKLEKISSSAIEESIMKIIKEKPGLSENAYMGLVMKEFKGRISGSEVMEIIKKYIK